jgi:hypothetical protein
MPQLSFPQQSSKCDQPHFPIEEFDDYSFAPASVPPILRTTSFECDGSREVWYTPVAEETAVIGLDDIKSKSLPPSLPQELELSSSHLTNSKSAPSSPASSSKQQRSKLRLNLSFKLKGFKNGGSGKGFSMMSRDKKKRSSSESNFSEDSTISSLQMDPPMIVEQNYSPSCSNSVTETEITEFRSNLSSRLLHEMLNIDSSFESDDMHLNPIVVPDFTIGNEPITTENLYVVEEGNEEVELVYDGLSIAINDETKTNERDTCSYEKECDVYFAGGTLDTVHGACGELTKPFEVSPIESNDSTLTKVSHGLASPTTTQSMSSFSSVSTSHSSTLSSSGILKPPKRGTEGYDPFGVDTDFETGIPRRTVHFFENIDEVEMAANVHLLSGGDSDSDDSTLSLEYAMRYCGLKTGLYDSSSSSESSRNDGDFAPVRS